MRRFTTPRRCVAGGGAAAAAVVAPLGRRWLRHLPRADVVPAPAAPYEAPPAVRARLAAAEASGVDAASLLVADTNVAVLVGVASNVTMGRRMGKDVTEFRLVCTNRARSGDGSLLVEKQAFKVVLLDRAALAGRSLVASGAIVHVVGRLQFLPRFNAASLAYDYSHEIVVSDACGRVTPVLREGAVPASCPT